MKKNNLIIVTIALIALLMGCATKAAPVASIIAETVKVEPVKCVSEGIIEFTHSDGTVTTDVIPAHNLVEGKCQDCGKYVVSNEKELRAAVLYAGAEILFANDITVTASEVEGSTPCGVKLTKNVTIDLNGYELKFKNPNFENGSSNNSYLLYSLGGEQTIKNGKIDASKGRGIYTNGTSAFTLEAIEGVSDAFFWVFNKPCKVTITGCYLKNLNGAKNGGRSVVYANNGAAGSTYVFENTVFECSNASCIFLNDMKDDMKSVATLKDVTLKTDFQKVAAFTRYVDIDYGNVKIEGVQKVGISQRYVAIVPEGIEAELMQYTEAK